MNQTTPLTAEQLSELRDAVARMTPGHVAKAERDTLAATVEWLTKTLEVIAQVPQGPEGSILPSDRAPWFARDFLNKNATAPKEPAK